MSILILTVARTRLVRHFLSDSISLSDTTALKMPHGLTFEGNSLASYDDAIIVAQKLTLVPDAEDMNELDDEQALRGADALLVGETLSFSDDIRGSLGFD